MLYLPYITKLEGVSPEELNFTNIDDLHTYLNRSYRWDLVIKFERTHQKDIELYKVLVKNKDDDEYFLTGISDGVLYKPSGPNKCGIGELQVDYRMRLKLDKAKTKYGRWFWNATDYGTFDKFAMTRVDGKDTKVTKQKKREALG